jgi:hypothetical protein
MSKKSKKHKSFGTIQGAIQIMLSELYSPETTFVLWICHGFCQDSAVSIVTGLQTGRPRGQSSSPGRAKNVQFSSSSRLALEPAQPRSQRIPGLFLGRKVTREWS